MTTKRQILANRQNAQRSTGPITPEGKAVVAQNAIKHGLFTEKTVILAEDPADFDRHRRTLLAGLKPVGPLETLLAERVVALAWRLLRTGRIQAEALDVLNPNLDWDYYSDAPLNYNRQEPQPPLVLGRTIVKDFTRKCSTMERLLTYECRMEQSLYKACFELERLQLRRLRHTPPHHQTHDNRLPAHVERITPQPPPS